MSLVELGALGEFVGAIGVVLTLLYLAVQMRQNTRAILSQIREQRSRASQENFHQAANMSELIAKSWAGEQLADAETIRLGFMASASLRGYEAYANERRDGLLGNEEWDAIKATLARHFRAPYMQTTWHGSQDMFSAGFREMVNSEIDTNLGIPTAQIWGPDPDA